MGDRVSISFKNGDEESVVLFSHWDGMLLVTSAKRYAKELKERTGTNCCWPIERHEPGIVMLDFILWYMRVVANVKSLESNYYIERSSDDGDNSDNGHHVIDITK